MMQALRYFPETRMMHLVTEEIPHPIKPDDVIVKVCYCGVCGTDLKIMKGVFPCSSSPLIPGHEISGIVSSVGAAVKNLTVGTKVGINPCRACGQCHYCRKGQPHYCTVDGLNSALGHYLDGGWAEFCRVSAEDVYPLPSELSLKLGVLCEPLSCILHGWESLGTVTPDSNILIIGAGIIGNLWASLFHHSGYRHVIISEIAEGRQKLAANLGIGFPVMSPSGLEDHFSRIKDLDKDGIDLIVDCSGQGLAVEHSMAWLRQGATVLIFGCAPLDSRISLSPWDIFHKELTVKGSLINCFTYGKTIHMVAAMADKYLDFEKLGVHIFTLEEYEKAFMALKNGQISKAVFKLLIDEKVCL